MSEMKISSKVKSIFDMVIKKELIGSELSTFLKKQVTLKKLSDDEIHDLIGRVKELDFVKDAYTEMSEKKKAEEPKDEPVLSAIDSDGIPSKDLLVKRLAQTIRESGKTGAELNDFVREVTETQPKDVVTALLKEVGRRRLATKDIGEGYTCLIIENALERYLQRLITTAMIGFVYQMNSEYSDLFGYEIDGIEMTPDRLQIIKFKQEIIKEFLDKIFKFDPTIHVCSAEDEAEGDPERVELKKTPPEELVEPIPSLDYYSKFQRYFDMKYETIEKTTHKAYGESKLLHWFVQVLRHFPAGEAGHEQATTYCRKQSERTGMEVRVFETGQGHWLAPYKANRQQKNYLFENNPILKRIEDKFRKDQEIAGSMLGFRQGRARKQRVKAGKSLPSEVRELMGLGGGDDTMTEEIVERMKKELVDESSPDYVDPRLESDKKAVELMHVDDHATIVRSVKDAEAETDTTGLVVPVLVVDGDKLIRKEIPTSLVHASSKK